MATGKQGFVRAAEPEHSVSMQREKDMRVQAPVTAMYIQAMPGLPAYTQPTAVQDAAVLPLPVPMMCTNQALPILTLHIASGAAVQQQRPETPASSPRPKSAGKHVCPHCGRDCLKPSVLEKHLRCHTGERPYPCTTCGISFKTQSNLYKHKRTQAHARLSSESGKSDFSSQESTESSREICSGPSLELQTEEESGDINKSGSVLPVPTTTTFSPVHHTFEEGKTASNTEWALRNAAVVGLIALPAHGQQEILNSAVQRVQLAPETKDEATSMKTKGPARDGRGPLAPNRTPLQRQEALFPKQCQGKSQSHDSTDSGFSESNELHLTCSPGDTLHDQSMESLPESSMELQEPGSSKKSPDVAKDDPKSKVSVQEKQKLEEHILKLISENSMLVDDRHLVNVRPRKTVLSKQGSIDLPMPYTYKDSFHFEMRSSKHHVSSLQTQDRRGRAMYSSVPTQHSTSLEHAPLTRSSSLPFSVGIQNSDRTTLLYQGNSVPLSRRCSAGNIYPFKSVDQHAQSHRSLVRQEAVDCLSVAEGASAERGSLNNLSSDGDCGDTSTESNVKRCRRKKSQKFAYNKWYMYGGGTFKKLYNTEKNNLLKSRKSTLSLEQTEDQGIQTSQQRDSNSSVSASFTSCPAVSPPAVNALTAQTSSPIISSYVLLQSPLTKQTTEPLQQGLAVAQGVAKQTDVSKSNLNIETVMKDAEKLETALSSPIPSERKKPKTEGDFSVVKETTDTTMRQQHEPTSTSSQTNENLRDVINRPLQSVCDDVFQTSSVATVGRDNRLSLHKQGSFSNPSSSNQTQLLFKRHSSPHFVASVSGTSGSPSAASNISPVSEAKTSFLPKYQLKIPCSTDGVTDPCVCNSFSLNTSSPSKTPQLSHRSVQQRDPETSTPSALLSQSATTSTISGQEQEGAFCTVAITNSTAITSVACISQNVNKTQIQSEPGTFTSTTAISETPTLFSFIPEDKLANMPTKYESTAITIHSQSGASSSILSQPLQTSTATGLNQAVRVNRTHSMDSILSHSSTATKPVHIANTTAGSVLQNNPATSVVVSRQPAGLTLDTNAQASQSSMNSIPLDISHTAFQGGQFESKMLLVNDSQALAQDTFYVRTADLQIVMQLISDEQLALIEPQIEKQDLLKVDGSPSFLTKDPEVSRTQPVSQGIHQQCSGDTETTQTQGKTKHSSLSQIPDISVGLISTNVANCSKDACDLHPQNIYCCPKGAISSQIKSEHQVPAPLDSSGPTLSQQKDTTCEDEKVLKDLTSECSITVEQSNSEGMRNLPSSHKLCTETVSVQLPSKSSMYDCISSNLSKSIFSGLEQSCGAKWANDNNSLEAAEAFLNNEPEKTPMLSKGKNSVSPEVPDTFKDHQLVQMVAGQHMSPHLVSGSSKSAEEGMEQIKAETWGISETLLLRLESISTTTSSQEKPLFAIQPSQPKSCQLASDSAGIVKQMCSRNGRSVCQYNPPNLRVMCSNSKLKHEALGDKSCNPSQAPVRHSSKHCSTLGEEVTWSVCGEAKALTASTPHVTSVHFESNKPVSKSTEGKSQECGEVPGDTDSFTGPQVGGSLQSSLFQREAGTGRQGWVPWEPESGGEDGERVGNKGMEQEDHARRDKREGDKNTSELCWTSAKSHLRLSQPVTNACHSTSTPEQLDTSSISDDATQALGGATSFPHDSPPLGQRECTHLNISPQVLQISSSKGTAKLISQSTAKEKERVHLQCHDRSTTLSTGQNDVKHLHPTCGHLLAHPLLVNAIQKEVQKETQTKEPKRHGTTKYSVSSSNTDPNGTINTTPTYTNPPTNSNATPICASAAHHHLVEPSVPQCHMGGSYLEEEESSSSSDDEGKLVIELE